jgi:hypothetical protein
MSRSYKKVPYCGDHKGKDKKRMANNHIRQLVKRNPEININYGAFKKHYEQYDICDYYWFCTWEEYWESEWRSYEHLKMTYPESKYCVEPDEKECYRRWLKYYRNK